MTVIIEATIIQQARIPNRQKSSRGTPYTTSLSKVLTGVSGSTFAIGWIHEGKIDIGLKISESMSIGANIGQIISCVARSEGAILPIAPPIAKKVTIPKMVTPIKTAHEPSI